MLTRSSKLNTPSPLYSSAPSSNLLDSIDLDPSGLYIFNQVWLARMFTFKQDKIQNLCLCDLGQNMDSSNVSEVDKDVGIGYEDQWATPSYQDESSSRTCNRGTPKISAAREAVIFWSKRARYTSRFRRLKAFGGVNSYPSSSFP